MNNVPPIIVGAGPVGLAAALFLVKGGLFPRVIELRNEISKESRALAVNPRTLEILEPTGVTNRMLELGLPIRGVYFWKRGRQIGTLSFSGLHRKYPCMLGLAQSVTERLLTQALQAAGGAVERSIKLVDCKVLPHGIQACIETSANRSRDALWCPWLLGADGAHSVARQRSGIEFRGSSFNHPWHLADAPLKTKLPSDYGHVFFREGGEFLFLIRVIDPTLDSAVRDHLWRVMSNRPEPLKCLVDAEQAGAPVWTSSFSVSHRVASTLANGSLYLAGDAAHVHSPIGARGMNLGLEDAWVFSELARSDRLAEYNRLRRPIDRRTTRQVNLLSNIASPESWPYHFILFAHGSFHWRCARRLSAAEWSEQSLALITRYEINSHHVSSGKASLTNQLYFLPLRAIGRADIDAGKRLPVNSLTVGWHLVR